MTPLPANVKNALRKTLSRHPEVSRAILFGSRAKGTHNASSDFDLALDGDVTSFQAASIAYELNDLPLPYTFDVKALEALQNTPVGDHVTRVGITVYTR